MKAEERGAYDTASSGDQIALVAWPVAGERVVVVMKAIIGARARITVHVEE